MANVNSTEIYEEVNRRFDAALAKGVVPWQKPWIGELSAPRNLQSGKVYRGINALILGLSEYSDPRWTTFNGCKNLGGKVRKGEKSTLVTLWKRFKVKDAAAPDGEKTIAMLRYFRVFNVEQCEFPEGAIRPWEPEGKPEGWDGIAECESVLADYIASDGAPTLGYGGNSAHYLPGKHHIQLPERDAFKSAEGFYGAAFHESAHSTAPMLGRELSGAFGSEKYGREELVAEMSSAFVLAAIGVEGDFDNSAAYLKNWTQAIQDDPKMLVKAAGQAQKAADRIQLITHDYCEK